MRRALAQPGLLDEERALADRSLSLIAYRRGMSRVLASSLPPENSFEVTTQQGNAETLRVGRSVELARSRLGREARRVLARVDVTNLDNPGLSLYGGAVLYLGGDTRAALPYLELSADLPAESSKAKLHRALSFWWGLQKDAPLDSEVMAGLFQTYAGLQVSETDRVFWRGDANRELHLIRTALLHGCCIDAAQERLTGLAGYVRSTPEMEAQFAYSLLLQGRRQAAQERLVALPASELQKPEPSLYYGLILNACGEQAKARSYLNRATSPALSPDQMALALPAQKAP